MACEHPEEFNECLCIEDFVVVRMISHPSLYLQFQCNEMVVSEEKREKQKKKRQEEFNMDAFK